METSSVPKPPGRHSLWPGRTHSFTGHTNPINRKTLYIRCLQHFSCRAIKLQYGINSTVRLPRLDLPTFSGNALEWQPFWDGFNAAVNSNSTISDVQKLNYLRSQLWDEASQVIAGFSLMSANYSHSVALLKDRYGQPQKLITAHMQALLDLLNPSMPYQVCRHFMML